MKNTKLIAILAILLVLIGTGAFFAGIKYQESKRPVGRQSQRAQGLRPVNGEIISSDDLKNITVKLPDGSSKIVLLTDSTSINKSDKATKEDLKVGEKVAVFGTENSDGSVTAQNVQLNPIIQQRSNNSPK